MFGNLMSRHLIKDLFGEDEHHIRVFRDGRLVEKDDRESRLGYAEYTLYPGRLKHQVLLENVASWEDDDLSHPYSLDPGEYIQVYPSDSVILPQGVVGMYCAVSTLIQLGLQLTAGRITPEYGKDGHEVVLGIQNASRVSVLLSKSTRLAHMLFFDLRAISSGGDAEAIWRDLRALEKKHIGERLPPQGSSR